MLINQIEDVNDQIIQDETNDIDTWLEHVCGITILHVNIRSISANWDQLLLILHKNIAYIDILVLTEISLVQPGECYNIDGFKAFSKPRKKGRGGGIGLFIRNNLNFSETCIDFETFEGLFGSISGHSDSKLCFLLLCVYRPPHCDKVNFVTEVERCIVENEYKNMILVGDVNIDMIKPNDETACRYKDVLLSNGFLSCINGVTREEYKLDVLSNTCIDHIFVRMLCNRNNINSVIYKTKMSDHYMIGIDLNCGLKNVNTEFKTPANIYLQEHKLLRLLKEVDWGEFANEQDGDILYDGIENVFKSIYQKSSSVRSLNPKSARQNRIWMSSEIINMVKQRDKLFRNWKNCTNLLKSVYRSEYKSYRNFVNKQIRRCKEQYYKQELEQSKCNVRGTWSIINELLGKTRKASADEVISKFIGKTDTNEKIVSEFANTFVNEVDKLVHACDITTLTCPNYQSVNFSMRMPTITTYDIKKIIHSLDARKQPGVEGIRVCDLKNINDEISPTIAQLINISIKNGKVPEKCKISVVKPIYKKGNHVLYTNYRPISLLPSIEKIMERCVATHLNKYLEKYNVINKFQYGFQKGKSTSDLLLSFSDFVNTKLDNNMHVLAVFIDYSKAFDTLNHLKLIRALESAGIRGPMLNWFIDYLKNRYFLVRVGNTSSGLKNSKTGVPQGSILGPILYIIYVNSIFGHILKCKIYIYADDIVIVAAHKYLSIANAYLQEDFTRASQWSHDSDLIINVSKTKVMHICSPFNRDVDAHFNLIYHSSSCLHLIRHGHVCQCTVEIETTDSHVYLGVLVDRYFSWKPQIDALCNRLRSCSYQLYKLQFILSFKTIRSVYCALVESLLLYGVMAWGNANAGHLQRISSIQNRMIKSITPSNVSNGKSLDFLYQFCNLLPFFKLFKYRLILKHYYCPQYRIKYDHNVNTRGQKQITYIVPTYINKYGKRKLDIAVPSFLNSMPDQLKTLEKFIIIKSELKNWLMWNV
jgi:Reverse transcriptase (RNA-dependent DNA polymerase)